MILSDTNYEFYTNNSIRVKGRLRGA